MAHAESQDSSRRAPQVCSHCKSIKKGCDKKLPSCSQCIKRRAVCRYGEPEDERSSRSENGSPQGMHTRLGPNWASVPRSLQATLPTSVRLSLLMMNSLSDMFPSTSQDHGTSIASASNTDTVVNAQVLHILGAAGRRPEEVVTRYFRGVHQWLPIISRRRFKDRYKHFQISPAADFSVLLLAMRLVTQHPAVSSDSDQDRELLYLATKTLFSQVQAFMPSSLFLVQTGVILGYYEHAHGMVEAAYVTIGTCGRMACAIGMHNKQCSAEMQGTDTWVEDEEVLCTWWGLVILDRVNASDHQIRGRPLATRLIREDDYLPLESYDLDREDAISESTFRYFVSATNLPGVGSFGREAQATYLYDRVRLAIENRDNVNCNLYHLGRDLQNLLALVMEQVAGRWGIYCGAIQMLITGLYNLHQTLRTRPELMIEAQYKNTTDVALKTLTRMVIDISGAANRDWSTYDMEVLHPAMAHIVKCAQQHILTATDLNDPQWQEDFDSLRKTMSYFNRRWSLAGMELHRLNETLEISLAMRM